MIPHTKFSRVPIVIPITIVHFFFVHMSDARPIIYAIIGKERMNPPVGPVIDCHPPVKFEKTGSPKAPNRTYMSVAVNAGFAPNIIAVNVIIKVWRVVGTPVGSSMGMGAMTQIRDVVSPIMHSSFVLFLVYFIIFYSPKVFQSLQNSIFGHFSQCGLNFMVEIFSKKV